jgi:DNA-binding HxlR family transcriptional regulator
MAKGLPKSFECATAFTVAVLGGKWKTVILYYLTQRPCRFSELRKLTPTLSDKVLTERLRELQSLGLIAHRPDSPEKSSGTYALAARGHSLSGVLSALYHWGHDHAAEFRVELGEPLQLIDRKEIE